MRFLKIFGSIFVIFSILVLLFILYANIYIISFARPYIITWYEELPPDLLPQTVITLWASVSSAWKLSDALQWRVDEAIALFEQWVVPTILISGDNRSQDYNELRAMRNYLVDQWVDKQFIFQDFAWFDTYDSMSRAQAIFQVDHAIVTTQQFHLYRAVYLGRKLWIDVRWIPSWNYHPWFFDKVYIREYFARVKAMLEIIFWSAPTFLWEPVPIDWESNGWVG